MLDKLIRRASKTKSADAIGRCRDTWPGLPNRALLGCAGDHVSLNSWLTLKLAPGWVALDARSSQVQELIAPGLQKRFGQHDPRLLLYEPDRPWAASRAQVLISECALETAETFAAWSATQAASEMRQDTRVTHDQVSVGSQSAGRERCWLPPL